jgi:hypothetical protein
MAAFSLINSILIAVNNKQTVRGIFCDLQKAFDCVNHEILLDELDFYGIEDTFKMLLKSYLTGRQQRVILGHLSYSNNIYIYIYRWETIKCKVPLSSNLGPLLSPFYINDLPKMVNKHNSIALYADDTYIMVTDTDKLNFGKNLNQTFNEINTWFNNNLLALYFEKTQYLEFQSMKCGNTRTQIIYDHKTISRGQKLGSLD